jgi:hypothetical protein
LHGWVRQALLSGVSIYLLSDVQMLLARHAGREELMALEMAAMLATGILAVVGAFFVAIPGRSRRWLLAPLAPFAAWLLLSGAGCYRELLHNGRSGLAVGHSVDCLIFIVTVSVVIGARSSGSCRAHGRSNRCPWHCSAALERRRSRRSCCSSSIRSQ